MTNYEITGIPDPDFAVQEAYDDILNKKLIVAKQDGKIYLLPYEGGDSFELQFSRNKGIETPMYVFKNQAINNVHYIFNGKAKSVIDQDDERNRLYWHLLEYKRNMGWLEKEVLNSPAPESSYDDWGKLYELVPKLKVEELQSGRGNPEDAHNLVRLIEEKKIGIKPSEKLLHLAQSSRQYQL